MLMIERCGAEYNEYSEENLKKGTFTKTYHIIVTLALVKYD